MDEIKTQEQTLYAVKLAHFNDHHPHHQGWDGVGWYYYLAAEGCDEVYGPFDSKDEAIADALDEAGYLAKSALGAKLTADGIPEKAPWLK